MSHLGKGRLAIKVLGHHGMFPVLSVRGGAIILVLIIVIGATVEIRRSFVLAWSAVLIQ